MNETNSYHWEHGGLIMGQSIGETLKKCRIKAGKSVKEISDLLISKGFKASEKT